jgi:DNA-binding CsgD family transcriptional regulator
VEKQIIETNNFELFNNPQFNNFLELSPGVTGIFNFDTLQYEYISKNVKNIFGYDSDEFMNGGLRFNYSILNTTHADIIASNIFPMYLEQCVKYASAGNLKKLRFSYEYMVNCKSGKAIWCLHQSTIMEVDENGYPLLDLFIITDINETKKDDLINFTIAKKNDQDVFDTIHTFCYQTKDLGLLSGREMQILKLLCEGNTTPKIASILHLSEHTVKTHRKNIMQKMEVRNSMDIMKIAYEKGLL